MLFVLSIWCRSQGWSGMCGSKHQQLSEHICDCNALLALGERYCTYICAATCQP